MSDRNKRMQELDDQAHEGFLKLGIELPGLLKRLVEALEKIASKP